MRVEIHDWPRPRGDRRSGPEPILRFDLASQQMTRARTVAALGAIWPPVG